MRRRMSLERETANPLQLRDEPDDAEASSFEVEAHHSTQTPVAHWRSAVNKVSVARLFSQQLEAKRQAARLSDARGDAASDSTSATGLLSSEGGWNPRQLTNDGVPAVVSACVLAYTTVPFCFVPLLFPAGETIDADATLLVFVTAVRGPGRASIVVA